MDDAILLQALQNLSSAFCQVAQGILGIHIDDVEGIAVLLVEGDAYQQSYLHTCMQFLPCITYEPHAYHVVHPGPAGNPGTGEDTVPFLLLFYQFAVKMTSVPLRGIRQFSHHPVFIIQAVLQY